MTDSGALLSSGIQNRAHYTPDIYTNINGLQGLENTEDQDAAFKEVAKQFESIFINIMLKNMRQANAVFEKDSLFNSNESRMYRDMYDNQMSLNLSNGKGIGLADTLYRQLKGQFGEGGSPIEAKHQFERAVASVTKAPEKDIPRPNGLTSLAPSKLSETEQPKLETTFEHTSFGIPEKFIEKIRPLVDGAAKAMGFHPLAVLAQAALETGWGKHFVSSEEGLSSHNLFNIKADKRWDGEQVSVTTTEFRAGTPVKEQASFRQYENFEQSIQDYLKFVSDNPRYEFALSVRQKPEAYVEALQEAGYATDPKYADKLKSVMNTINDMLTEAQP